MKKSVLFLLAGMTAIVLFAGCGKANDQDGQSTQNGAHAEGGEYVTLGDYQNMEVAVARLEVTDADVQSYVEQMLAYSPVYEETDKTVVESGDIVDIDFEGLIDGEAFDGGTAAGYKLTIGSGSFIDGFEDGLIGVTVGDEVALDLAFPDPYLNNPDLAGVPVVFNVKINAIVQQVEMTYDALTDEFVSSNLGYETVEAMKEDISSYLESQSESVAESNKRSAIVEKLREISTIHSVPEDKLQERVDKYIEQMRNLCTENYQMELEEYLEQNNQTTLEDFTAEIKTVLKESIELELLLGEIAKAEGIEVDQEGYDSFVSTMVYNYGFASEEGLYEEYGEEFIKDSYLCNKAMEYLAENVKVTEAADTDGE